MQRNESEKSLRSGKPENLIGTTVIENLTTVEIEVDKPYNIMSDGGKLVVNLRRHDIDACYEYYAVPKNRKEISISSYY